MIAASSPELALASVVRSLRLPATSDQSLSDEVIAQALRRAVHILAPCAAHVVSRSVRVSLSRFGGASEVLEARIEDIIDALIAYGDILEMRGTAEEAWDLPEALLLRPAPPSFVIRKCGSVVLLGVAGDEITPLADDWDAKILHHGALRVLRSDGSEDVPGLLRELGLLELSEKVWLRVPKMETAKEFSDSWRRLLSQEPASAAIEGLRILDTSTAPTFYRDRWDEPKKQHDGFYVARRPQRYGADRWCVVDLERGALKRFKDLIAPGDRIRPCDVGWRIQAALDAEAGKPQQYRRIDSTTDTRISFFSPLPSWAERHLAITGDKTRGERCLYSYDMPKDKVDEETRFLREALWLTDRSDSSE